MKYILLLFLTSCAYNTTIPNSYRTTKTIEYTYSCPYSYIMAKDSNNRLFCVLSDNRAYGIENGAKIDLKPKRKRLVTSKSKSSCENRGKL